MRIYEVGNIMVAQAGRILVVDDLEDNLFLMKTLLESEGYEVDTAESGLDALEKVQISQPDLMLLDIMMPGMNGYEVASAIRQCDHLKSIPILFVTAHGNGMVAQTLPHEVSGFIRKPIDFDELLANVQTYIYTSLD
jgi:CheY-like chemotaxis protein